MNFQSPLKRLLITELIDVMVTLVLGYTSAVPVVLMGV
jgi:hypothetical protein